MAVPTKAVGKLGGRIPAIGYGVGTAWFNTGKNGDQTAKAALVESVGAALTAGFTHVDEAEVYGNEVFDLLNRRLAVGQSRVAGQRYVPPSCCVPAAAMRVASQCDACGPSLRTKSR